MATHKIDSTVLQNVQLLSSAIENYESAVVGALAAVKEVTNNELKGQSYTGLVNSIQKEVNTQKQLAAECKALDSQIQSYINKMLQEESVINFGS